MSQDFLHNLITRHLGLEPVLQPRPASRFESTQNVYSGMHIEEPISSATESRHFQQEDYLRSETLRRPPDDAFLHGPGDQQQSPAMTTPPIVNSVAGERKTQPPYSPIQASLGSTSPAALPQEAAIAPVSFNEHNTQMRSSEISFPMVGNRTNLYPTHIADKFDIAEVAELLGREKTENRSVESSNRPFSDHSQPPQTSPREIVTPIESQPVNRSIDYHELKEIVRQLRDELANGKEARISKSLSEQNIRLPTLLVPHEKSVVPTTLDNAFHNLPESGTNESKPEPVINVTIGRVEVRAVQQADPPKSKRQQSTDLMSLDDYLRKRGGGQA